MHTPTPTLKPAFEIGVLFAMINDSPVLLQICSDFDFAQRTLNEHLGRSSQLFGNQPMMPTKSRTWSVNSQKDYDYVFNTFFRPFSDNVRNKPEIRSLILMPSMLDSPIMPNDLGDRT